MFGVERFLEKDLSHLYVDTWVRRDKSFSTATIISIVSAGNKTVSGIQTSTGTFIAEGYFSHNSFWYYTNERYARFIRPAFKGKFQLSRVTTFYPSKFEEENKIPIVQADLICFKEPYYSNWMGERLI
jgi:hypothetical protein